MGLSQKWDYGTIPQCAGLKQKKAEANTNGNANDARDYVPIYRKGKSSDLFHKEPGVILPV